MPDFREKLNRIFQKLTLRNFGKNWIYTAILHAKQPIADITWQYSRNHALCIFSYMYISITYDFILS